MWEHITKYWINYLCSLVTAALAFAYKKTVQTIKEKSETQDNLKAACLALLHDRLYQACTHYINQGEIDADGLRNLEYLYEAYHDLGGNGTGEALYKRAQALPLKKGV